MPTYAVFKVTSINTATNIITANLITGPLTIPAPGTEIKATFVKATDIELIQNGSNAAINGEITFNYRTKF